MEINSKLKIKINNLATLMNHINDFFVIAKLGGAVTTQVDQTLSAESLESINDAFYRRVRLTLLIEYLEQFYGPVPANCDQSELIKDLFELNNLGLLLFSADYQSLEELIKVFKHNIIDYSIINYLKTDALSKFIIGNTNHSREIKKITNSSFSLHFLNYKSYMIVSNYKVFTNVDSIFSIKSISELNETFDMNVNNMKELITFLYKNDMFFKINNRSTSSLYLILSSNITEIKSLKIS